MKNNKPISRDKAGYNPKPDRVNKRPPPTPAPPPIKNKCCRKKCNG